MGALFVVRYMRYENSHPGRVYVDGTDAAIRAKFIAYAARLAEVGRLPDETYGHFLKGKFSKIYEVKPGRGRVFGFFHERTLYITNGADKKKPKEQERDYEE